MKNVGVGFLALCVFAGLVGSGCSRTANAESVATTASPSPTPTPSTAPSPSPQPSGPDPVAAIDFEQLMAFVPDLTGWTRTTPMGQQIKTTISYARAYADYSKGESLIRLELTDSGYNSLLLSPLSMMLVPSYWERSTDGFRRYAAISGQPGFESWENDAKDGEVTVVAGKRYIVNARGTSVSNIETVRSLVQNVDLAKLAMLK